MMCLTKFWNQTKFWIQKRLGPKNVWTNNMLDLKLVLVKKNWIQTNFRSKKCCVKKSYNLWSTKIWIQKYIGSKKMWRKKFWV